MRRHISKALQTRSKAIRTALEGYNKAALALTPPRKQLDWDQVVKYAFLSEFDLLRDARQDVRDKPWATAAGRYAMDRHFKIARAKEELQRLDVEIKRLWTFIHDESAFLKATYKELEAEGNYVMALQVRTLHRRQATYDWEHRERLRKLGKTLGFSGVLKKGLPLDTARRQRAQSKPTIQDNLQDGPGEVAKFEEGLSMMELEEDWEDEELDDEGDEEIPRSIDAVLHISEDGGGAVHLRDF